MTMMLPTTVTRRSSALAATLTAALALAACRDEGGSAPKPAPAQGRVASLDPRSQYDLAAALTQVETARDRADLAAGYARLRTAWVGRRYRWTVRVVGPLCRSRDACNVLPFDRAGRDRKVVQGWMPRLDLDEGAFAALQRACAGRAPCEVQVEGTLSRMIADTQNPTSLEFSQVRVL
jgi:hypothetical protein